MPAGLFPGTLLEIWPSLDEELFIPILGGQQLSSYFDEYGLFVPNQYGFRPKHSTEYAALELIDRIINKMDRNEIQIDIFLDLSKAFDTIDHTILLHKLKYYGLED